MILTTSNRCTGRTTVARATTIRTGLARLLRSSKPPRSKPGPLSLGRVSFCAVAAPRQPIAPLSNAISAYAARLSGLPLAVEGGAGIKDKSYPLLEDRALHLFCT